MAHMFGRIAVEDYSHFRNVFDSHEDIRQAAGVTGHTVFRSVDDPNEVTIKLDFSTAEAAKAFAASEPLHEAMKEAGVQGPPTIWFVHAT